MHIEPGLVDGAKIALGYATASASLGYAAKLAWEMARKDGVAALAVRTLLATAQVHLILGTTLLLLLGAAPAALGLAAGLLVQGLFFAPQDLPQYGMNVTTLLVPLFAMAALARRIVPAATAYVDISYAQAFKLSVAYQGGIVLWVGFWALYGRGMGADNLAQISSFGAAYMGVVLAEPLIDLAVLALAKHLRGLQGSLWVQHRLHHAA
jgi:ABC-type Co2+ transport system permease subunit